MIIPREEGPKASSRVENSTLPTHQSEVWNTIVEII